MEYSGRVNRWEAGKDVKVEMGGQLPTLARVIVDSYSWGSLKQRMSSLK